MQTIEEKVKSVSRMLNKIDTLTIVIWTMEVYLIAVAGMLIFHLTFHPVSILTSGMVYILVFITSNLLISIISTYLGVRQFNKKNNSDIKFIASGRSLVYIALNKYIPLLLLPNVFIWVQGLFLIAFFFIVLKIANFF